jgi:hypothetical protein
MVRGISKVWEYPPSEASEEFLVIRGTVLVTINVCIGFVAFSHEDNSYTLAVSSRDGISGNALWKNVLGDLVEIFE